MQKCTSDYEYAARIYCKVFDTDNTDDMYVIGVFETMRAKLTARRKRVLEYYYRDGCTLKQIDKKFNTDAGYARNLRDTAINSLKCPPNADKMSVAKIVEDNNKMHDTIKQQNDVIDTLRAEIERIKPINLLPLSPEVQKMILSIDEMDFSIRTSNALKRHDINYAERLLEYDTLKKLRKIRNLGRKSIEEMVVKMREFGYFEWADKIEDELKPRLQRTKISETLDTALSEVG